MKNKISIPQDLWPITSAQETNLLLWVSAQNVNQDVSWYIWTQNFRLQFYTLIPDFFFSFPDFIQTFALFSRFFWIFRLFFQFSRTCTSPTGSSQGFFKSGWQRKRGQWTYGRTGEVKGERAKISGKMEESEDIFRFSPLRMTPRAALFSFSLSWSLCGERYEPCNIQES